jgi:choline dehydrogenase-like flavoprotein
MEAAGVACVVLESGGLDVEEASRDLNRGSSAGEIDYQFGDGCRSRFLGGSSNCWGFCRAFEPSDFERRAWVAHSGWPIGYAEFQPYVQRAHQWLKLGPVNYDPAHWVSAIGRSDVQRFPCRARD